MFHVKHANGSKSTNPSSGAGSSVRTWSRPPRCPRSGPATSSIRRSSPPCSPTIQRATPSMSAAAPVFQAWCLRSCRETATSLWSRPTASAAPSCARSQLPPAPQSPSSRAGSRRRSFRRRSRRPARSSPVPARRWLELLGLVFPVLESHTYCIFPKGRHYRSELEEARRRWDFRADIVPSRTAAEARILRISDVERRRS